MLQITVPGTELYDEVNNCERANINFGAFSCLSFQMGV